MSPLSIAVAVMCAVAGGISAIAIVQWLRERAALEEERERLRKFNEEVAKLKALLEPSQAWKDKEAAKIKNAQKPVITDSPKPD